ncbi:MAG: bestrophin family protein [Planctomycetaceae bacterium]|nr:bestrophin family protein [Planctomycetaceae bacterium]
MNRSVVREVARSETLRRVAIYAVCCAAYALLVSWIHEQDVLGALLHLPSDLHAVFTLVLGWLLVFRTNASYSRWWEARKLWGALVNVSRNMAIKVADLCKAGDDELTRFRVDIIAYAYGLKNHLRGESQLQKLKGFESCPDQPSHVPSYLVTRMYEEVGSWKANGFIDGDDLRVLDAEARQFLDICGGCERIRNTRIVQSYRTFARQCVGIYLVTFPWGVVNDFEWWTAPVTIVVSYFMLGLETVAEHVEEPFGYDEDDLDLDGLCRTIEVTVEEVFDRRTARNQSTLPLPSHS